MKTFTVYGRKGNAQEYRLVFRSLAGTPGCLERGKQTAKQNGFTELKFHEQPSIANGLGRYALNQFTIKL